MRLPACSMRGFGWVQRVRGPGRSQLQRGWWLQGLLAAQARSMVTPASASPPPPRTLPDSCPRPSACHRLTLARHGLLGGGLDALLQLHGLQPQQSGQQWWGTAPGQAAGARRGPCRQSSALQASATANQVERGARVARRSAGPAHRFLLLACFGLQGFPLAVQPLHLAVDVV